MKNLFLFSLVSFLTFTLVVSDADARRLGGGKSFGRSAPTFQKSPAQQNRQNTSQTQSRQNQPGATGRTSGASRWLGPLAGLAAGGLLAALLFGDGFEGFQFMDFILIIALVMGALFLFRMLRAKNATSPPMQRQAYAPAGPAPASTSGFEAPEIGSAAPAGEAVEYRPSWFDEEKFLQGAKTHFVRLQAAWDVGDMKDIRDYTTPELFAELTLERQSDRDQAQFTDVVSLDTELLSMVKEGDQVVASVRYSGMIREDKNTDPHPFNEIWHVQRAANESNANWYVAGIQQESKRG